MFWGFGSDDKKKKSIFDPVDSWGSTGSTNSDSWGFNTSSQNQSNWGYSNDSNNNNFYASNSNSGNFFSENKQSSSLYGYGAQPDNGSSFAYGTGQKKGHWGSQQGYGLGDTHGFGNDHNLRQLETMYSSNSWGSGGGSGSGWHFSNAGRDLDIHHGINNARRQNAANDMFASSWGHSSTKSHFSKSSGSPSSFNPFSSGKIKNWGDDIA